MSQSALLARRLQQNWMDRYPYDMCQTGSSLDDSLTSLGWLQNLRVSEFTQTRQTSSPEINNNRILVKQELCTTPPAMLLIPETDARLQVGVMTPDCSSSFMTNDHRTNPYVKPPYSYATLICMAMKATKKNKITLASIYNWITGNFMYYRLSDPSWQNSIRHNLSLNKYFEKVARRKDEPGKGGFWRINPEYRDLMDKAVLNKRRGSRDTIPSPPFKRFKLDDDDTFSPAEIWNKTREDRLLSNCSGDFDTNEEDSENSLTCNGNLNWTAVLNQDIEVGGKTIKTQAILDECENWQVTSLSPPSSETNSDDLGLDFLSQTDFSMNIPVDFQTNDPLDLTVQGTNIRPPDWWAADDNNNMVNISDDSNNNNNANSGLNTPVPTSPEIEHGDINWGESVKLGSSGNSFDLDSLFDFGKVRSPLH